MIALVYLSEVYRAWVREELSADAFDEVLAVLWEHLADGF